MLCRNLIKPALLALPLAVGLGLGAALLIIPTIRRRRAFARERADGS